MVTHICAQCGRGFQAYRSAKRVTCSNVCKYLRRGEFLAGMEPALASDGRRLTTREQFRAEIHREFGQLSSREVRLIRRVYWKAYNTGYGRALCREPRKQVAA